MKVLLLKRIDDKNAQFDFFNFNSDSNESDLSQQLDLTKSHLKSVLSGDRKLQHKMSIPHFYDESNQNLIESIIFYLEEFYTYLTERFFWESLLGNSSYMMIMFCTILFVWLMMIFSSEKSNPNAASAKAKQKK